MDNVLRDHLVYIDITNICSLGCEFCMYKHERTNPSQHMRLTDRAHTNLSHLINHPKTQHIIISGEGEPFTNPEGLHAILNMSAGHRYFQIVTNGMWINRETIHELERFQKTAAGLGDHYSIRLSIDQYHVQQMDTEKYVYFLRAAAEHGHLMPNLHFAIRSLMEDRKYTRELIISLLGQAGIPHWLECSTTPLDDELHLGSGKVNITYKNLVYPDDISSALPMEEYIRMLENKHLKPFTFGNMATPGPWAGLDVTVKYTGEVFFYGIETKPVSNIYTSYVSIEELENVVVQDPLIKTLYSIPFLLVLQRLRRMDGVRCVIREVNNPYWLIRRLWRTHRPQLAKAVEGIMDHA